MTRVVLFHHVQGLTPGVLDLAERLRAGGHEVTTPDLFDGVLPGTLEEGMAHVGTLDDDEQEARAAAAVGAGPVVLAGISIGVMHAQRLAVARPDVLGVLLYEACLPLTGEWGVGPWREGVAVQVHGMDDDPFFAHEGDLDAARELVAATDGELFTYPGSRHLFVDSSLPSYDEAATSLVLERSSAFLDRVG